jgi:hypothetical protein
MEHPSPNNKVMPYILFCTVVFGWFKKSCICCSLHTIRDLMSMGLFLNIITRDLKKSCCRTLKTNPKVENKSKNNTQKEMPAKNLKVATWMFMKTHHDYVTYVYLRIPTSSELNDSFGILIRYVFLRLVI